MVEVKGMKDAAARERVLRAASRNVTFADDVNLKEIVSYSYSSFKSLIQSLCTVII